MVRFPYGACVRLLGIASQYWRAIDGACARKGFDPLDYNLTRFLHLILAWTQEHVEPAEWERVEGEIFAPFTMAGRDADYVDQAVVDEEMALFANFSRETKALGV
jgi:hypothetical protein